MPDFTNLLSIAVTLYVVGATIFIVSENRRPQSSFAWLFLFFTLPVVAPVLYVLFGRMRGGVGRTRTLTRHDLPGHLVQTLDRLQAEHVRAIEDLAGWHYPRDRLARMIHSNSNVYVTLSNRVELLQDASRQYPRLMDDLRAARSSIHLQYYIWENDTVSAEFEAILIERAAAGVEVRLLYDPVGSIGSFGPFRQRALRAAGIDVRPYSPLWRVHTISYRNHRKIAVIDGRIGHTGGLNIGKQHLDPGRGFARWRDTNLRLEGAAVLALQGVFAIDWSNATRERLLGPEYFPEAPPLDDNLPVQLCLSGPDSEWRAVRQQYFAMIVGARRRVRVQTPFFILDDTVMEALKAAALAGVDVSVMISARGPGQHVPYWAANTFKAEAAEAGVEVLLYEDGYLHAKTVTVDGEVASVGSGNWDIRSFSINYELNALVYDARLAGDLEAAYDADRAACRVFDADAYRALPFWMRLRDSAARLVSPLM
ncbi:cardiolipin synthase [Jannaschia rubra]|uniref:Cardiolipin synthase n=1 Tax=Jannaschia rubra TaxID=282197 RepID=A0A0M6XJH3_9RHOB|nr:cardiolipin synthase [Jannaschia rubra]CTQ31249.1 Major cardiolipin synthase ClsA [Jannaschia rubra]SFF89860.1 cardiolipin synthase [Jannaschia rubra]